MNTPLSAALLAVVALAASACDGATEPESRLLLSTTQSTFTLPQIPEPNVAFVVSNEESSAVHLARCGDRIVAVVDRMEEGRWVQHSGGFCRADQPMLPLELAPGETAHSETAIGQAGRYRLHVGRFADGGGEADWSTTSNAFEIEPDAP